MRYLYIFCWSVFLFISCICCNSKPKQTEEEKKAQEIVDKAIAVHGGENFTNINIAFDFRDRHYTAHRNNGKYTYARSFRDSTGQAVEDILTNDYFKRKINRQEVDLSAERKTAFSESVNSVIYFALLPYGLNDQAVQKTYLGETTIKQQPYHKIKVSFEQEGGGIDYEDEYIYWIHQKTFRVDYLAYSFHTDGGGLRLRVAYNPQIVGGIRFQQYINYEPQQKSAKLLDLDQLYESGQLKELSRIELKNIKVLE